MSTPRRLARPDIHAKRRPVRGRGEIGKRKGLKIPRPQGLAGSSPAARTSFTPRSHEDDHRSAAEGHNLARERVLGDNASTNLPLGPAVAGIIVQIQEIDATRFLFNSGLHRAGGAE